MDENLEHQQQEDAAFEASFNAVAGIAEPPAAPAQEKPAAEAKDVAEQPAAEEKPVEAAAAPAEEEARFAGFTESELKNLLARVPELEGQVRKAHGKLGEYGAVIQELRKAPAQQALTPERIQEIEAAFPDAAHLIRERQEQQHQQASEQAPQREQAQPSPVDMQLELMDHFHDGWRDKIQGQDFKLWIAAQPEDVRTTFDTTEKAKDLHAVITKFDAWSTAQQTRQAKSSSRLQNALTPTGTAGKPKTAPTENDAFEAAFNATIRGR